MNFSDVFEKSGFSAVCKSIQDGKYPVSVAGIGGSAAAHFSAECAKGKRALIVAYNNEEAKEIYNDIRFFSEDVFLFRSKEPVFYNVDAKDRFFEYRRIRVLDELAERKSVIVVASLEAALEYTISPGVFKENRITIRQGDEYDTQELSKKLVEMGYIRADVVEGCGQFSVRGGIVDIFSPKNDFPYRIEFFGDEVDSVRIFDYVSQRTMDMTDEARILPCREAILTGERRERIAGIIDEKIKKLKRKKTDTSALIAYAEGDKERLLSGLSFPDIDKYASLIYDKLYTVLDHFSPEDMIICIEPKRLAERAKGIEWEYSEIIKGLIEKDMILTDGIEQIWDLAGFTAVSQNMVHISLNALSHTTISYKYKAIFDFSSRPTISLHGKIDYLFDDLNAWKKENKTVVILAKNRSRGENISGVLNDKGIGCAFLNETRDFKEGEISVMTGELKKGFEYPAGGFILISEQEIFDTDNKRRQRKIENAKRIKAYTDISEGDYVVHRAHGIGKYAGMKKMTVNGVTKDYLKIQYRGADMLYIPVDQMDLLYKYSGNGDKEIKLNKLNSTEWHKTTAKVKKSTAETAKKLVALYAERMKTKGFAYPPDGPWQRDFENTFLYDETDDQLRSIEEVKNDMESARPMDRLLCGDVGFGKTEVAIRAAFKAAVNSKQVAYLCPTTVLAMQHYDTFKSRMQEFAVNVEMLSRFRTPKQQKKIIKDIKNGTVDIIIGTHRLLQKDIEFRDLGLLIIDEEQRFGVAAKERLKELKKSVDVLSMTATPIPRTLHMSMISVRDMSVLETPPENRYPVQTFVLEYNEPVIIEAMKRELARGGQVFYLHNRVGSIYAAANRIKELIPDARVAVGHGKMNEEELEDIMYDMVRGDTDILVCTTIIETGLDIPNANTIIITNADRMGLAQLYQLRGRVGRSNRSAYAYLTYSNDAYLTEVAEKRLRAIKEYTEFGSGFKIAMRDLEIRGAGNVLGPEQHGHMDAVGYDLYCKILGESISEAEGKIPDADIEATVDADRDAYIPEKYIESHDRRIEIYKKIASVRNDEDAGEITDELIDRFGEPPKAVLNLINISLIRAMASAAGMTDVIIKKMSVTMKFVKDGLTPEQGVKLISAFPGRISPLPAAVPALVYRGKEPDKVFDNIKFVLQTVIGLKNEEK